MKAYDLFESALSLLGTTQNDSPEYTSAAVTCINILLCETRDCDDTLRASKGLPEHSETPRVTALSDELPCEDELANAALVYGLCSRLLYNDDDMSRVAYFQNMYMSEVEDKSKAIAGPVRDVYAGDAE